MKAIRYIAEAGLGLGLILAMLVFLGFDALNRTLSKMIDPVGRSQD